MKKLILPTSINSILLFLFLSCSSNHEVGQGIEIPPGSEVLPYDNIPGLSFVRAEYADQSWEEGDAMNGVRHGSWVLYNKDGSMRSSTTYYLGKKHGMEMKFDQQGYVSAISRYYDDQLHGTLRTYNRKSVIEERSYTSGKLNGPVKKYYENGKLMEESNYQEGVLHGLAKWYDMEGNLKFAYEYKNGNLVNENPDVSASAE